MQKEIEIAVEELGFDIQESDYKILNSSAFSDFFKNNSVIVGGKIAKSTLLASLIEYKQLQTK
jgi:hypothetical protein